MYKIHITNYLDETISTYQDRIAVYDRERCITFTELYDNVLKLAWKINKNLKGRTGQIIAVYLPKKIESVIADLAILYSGNAYMNLDIKSPEQRIFNIIEQTSPVLCLTEPEQFSKLPNIRDKLSISGIDQIVPLTKKERETVLALRDSCIDTDLLCIINTSGSTGTPKAVALNHRSFIDFTEEVCEAGLVGDTEVVASLSPLVFDIFSFELCMLMAKGSTLVLVPDSFAAFPVRLLELLALREVTYLFWVPTIMVNIANMDLLSKIPLPNLKMVWFAGEVFPTAKFNYWRKHLPQTTFANFYGPIEITLDCVYHVVERPLRDDEPIPIGKPFKNTGILVLTEEDRVAAPGEEGELCIRGSSLAMGYYNNTKKTSAAFVQNPLNSAYPEFIYRTGDIVAWNEYGELVFKGRKDTLIKHQGYRIELAEIEHVVVNNLGLVPNCCALYDTKNKKIVLIYESPCILEERNMRQKISEVLPKYMVPTVYHQLSELPRNTNGKIDRLALRTHLEQTENP